MTWLRAAIVVAIGALALQGATRSTPLNPAPPGNEWRVYGHDLAQLRDTADDVAKVLGTISGVLEPKVEPQVSEPTVANGYW